MDRVYQLISKFPNISSAVIARLYNVEGNKITNEIVNKTKPENVDKIEKYIAQLLKKKKNKIILGVGGYPKRYITTEKPTIIEENDDDYYYQEDNRFNSLPFSDFKSQHEMRETYDTHIDSWDDEIDESWDYDYDNGMFDDEVVDDDDD
jgi:hypothetical protein